MEQQNASSHPLLPSGFSNRTFAPSFSNIPQSGSNPLFASTLQQLQELSSGTATGLLPNNSQLTFASDFNNIAAVGWPTAQNAAWFEQAKVAAILPMYTVLSAGGVRTSGTPSNVGTNVLSPASNSTENTASTSIESVNSGIFPLNPIGLKNENDLSESGTPDQSVLVGSIHSSPASGIVVVDGQPGSVNSHCSVIPQPCTPLGLNSLQGPNSVHGPNSVQGPNSVPASDSSHSSVHGSSSVHGPNSIQGANTVQDLNSIRGPNSVPGSYSIHVTDCIQTQNPEVSPCENIQTSHAATAVLLDVANRPCIQQSSQDCGFVRGDSSLHSPSLVGAHTDVLSCVSIDQQRLANIASAKGQDTCIASTSSDLNPELIIHSPNPSSSSPQHDTNLDPSNLEDLPWSSIDFGDIDLFGGASLTEKDVMHSVLDMDPSAMHRIFMNEPSSSAAPAPDFSKSLKTSPLATPVPQIVTPKIREKIKMRREKELADADKELDRLLSLVAKKDATASSHKPRNVFSSFEPTHLVKPDMTSDERKISLSPVQFTPPESPTPSTSANAPSSCSFFFPSSALPTSTSRNIAPSRDNTATGKSRLVFMPPVEKRNKVSKVPVYKQKAKTFLFNDLRGGEQTGDDAYSFKDDEEDSKPLPISAVMTETQLKEQRLEAEVAQRLARINSAHSELKGKAGISDVQNQDLWRHVVPKKRHSAAVTERPSVPSTPLLPPASLSEHRPNNGCSREKAINILESLQERKQHRTTFGFLKTECLDDQETAKSENILQPVVYTINMHAKDDTKLDGEARLQPLPKLLIRLPRRSVDENMVNYEKPKKKKKRKRDSDYEWNDSESRRKKKKKKKKHKHRESRAQHESDLDTESKKNDQCDAAASSCKDSTVFSKKKRLMMHWNEAEESLAETNSHGQYLRRSSDTYSNLKVNTHAEQATQNVLSKFCPANGHLPKGTFVVCKADVMKEDCALWRVDNQNLLQKYPPFIVNGKLLYKNSSTYSGWCDQIANGYIVVQVRFIKHSRSETIVEPDIPLIDMFPAVSYEIEDKVEIDVKTSSAAIQRRNNDILNNDPLKAQMIIYVKAMLNHAMDLSFLKAVRRGNDWNYLYALNDIDKLNQKKKEMIQARVKWLQRYVDYLNFYSFCVVSDTEGCGLNCQACGSSTAEKVVQLFCNEGYDYDSLEPEEMRYAGSGSPVYAMEYLVCCSCSRLSVAYHKLHHMRYLLLKKCEDQLEKICGTNTELTQEVAVEACMGDSDWLEATLNEYCELWRKIELTDC